jgi:hypothetical protein
MNATIRFQIILSILGSGVLKGINHLIIGRIKQYDHFHPALILVAILDRILKEE